MELDEIRELYQDVILDHGKSPRNFGLEGMEPQACDNADNPMCGDQVAVCVETEDNKISNIKFHGKGCAISIASASMLTGKVKGMDLQEAQEYARSVVDCVTGNTELSEDELGDIIVLKGVSAFPTRIKCATMAWHCLLSVLREIDGQQGSEDR